jgi:hypothetical protein
MAAGGTTTANPFSSSQCGLLLAGNRLVNHAVWSSHPQALDPEHTSLLLSTFCMPPATMAPGSSCTVKVGGCTYSQHTSKGHLLSHQLGITCHGQPKGHMSHQARDHMAKVTGVNHSPLLEQGIPRIICTAMVAVALQ